MILLRYKMQQLFLVVHTGDNRELTFRRFITLLSNAIFRYKEYQLFQVVYTGDNREFS